jgi:uncharacterized cupin superfamily protein
MRNKKIEPTTPAFVISTKERSNKWRFLLRRNDSLELGIWNLEPGIWNPK